MVNPVIFVRKRSKIQTKKSGKKNFIPTKAKEAPKKVEAPLPPYLNLKKIGKSWPNVGKKATKAICQLLVKKLFAKIVGIAPFKTSKVALIIPYLQPKALAKFVWVIDLEPISLTSTFFILPIRKAVGIEPKR